MSAPVHKKARAMINPIPQIPLDVLQLILYSVIRDSLPEIAHINPLGKVCRYWWRALRMMSLYTQVRDNGAYQCSYFRRNGGMFSYGDRYKNIESVSGCMIVPRQTGIQTFKSTFRHRLQICWAQIAYYLNPRDIVALKLTCKGAQREIRRLGLGKVRPEWVCLMRNLEFIYYGSGLTPSGVSYTASISKPTYFL